jgi:serine/threonine protein kinase
VEWDAAAGVKTISLVMKYAPFGSLLKYLQRKQQFKEEEIRTVMAQLLLAIDLMHRKRIVHRDLKPDNILLMDKESLKVCISDLGLTCKLDDQDEIKEKCGTPGYVAPEVLKGQSFSPKADIFSLGCFFYNMLTCQCLFGGRNAKEVLI